MRVKKGKPATEIELEDLQEKYLKEPTDEVWQRMFHIMIDYARSLVLKLTKGRVFLEPDHVLNVATDSAIKIMKRYKEDPNFRINYSFGGLLQWKVRECLYGARDEEDHSSLNFIVSSENGNVKELSDVISDATVIGTAFKEYENITDSIQIEDLIDTMKILFEEYDDSVDNYRLWLLGRSYILLMLRKPKKSNVLDSFNKHLQITPREVEILNLLNLEVKNRLKTLINF